MAETLLTNLVNPQVMGDIIDHKLVDAMKFAPLCDIDRTLEGRAGSKIYLPQFSYIGDADVVAENSAITPKLLSATMASVAIKKIAVGVTLTDEAVLSGYGDPWGEAADQIVLSIASKLDNEVLAVLDAISGTMLYQTANSTTAVADTDITAALEKFGEDIDGVKVALVSPAVYTAMRSNVHSWVPASEVAANIAVRGIVGEYQGCQIMVSNKLTTPGTAYIVKPGALRIFIKRDTLVEVEREVKYFRTTIAASKHFAAYLYNASKAIKLAKHS